MIMGDKIFFIWNTFRNKTIPRDQNIKILRGHCKDLSVGSMLIKKIYESIKDYAFLSKINSK